MNVVGTGTMALKGRVTVFSISGCPHCRRAKQRLKELGLGFTEINLDEHSDRRAEMQKRSGRKTVPQVFFNDRHIGGADELIAVLGDDATRKELVALLVNNEAGDLAPAIPDPSRRRSEEVTGATREDPMMNFVRTLKAGIKVSDRLYHLQTYKSCFVGKDAVTFIASAKGISRGEAVEVGRKLLGAHFFHHVSAWDPPLSAGDVLLMTGVAGVLAALLLGSFAAFRVLPVNEGSSLGSSSPLKTPAPQGHGHGVTGRLLLLFVATACGLFFVLSYASTQVAYDHDFKDEKLFYRFLEDEETSALNAGTVQEVEPRPAQEVAEELRRRILAIYEDFLSDDGTQVDYEGIAESEAFRQYDEKARQLQRVNVVGLPRAEKLAFFINIYNALVIHANVLGNRPTNSWARLKFFNNVAYVIGGHVFTLNGIENGVLRGNKRGPFAFSREFGPRGKDPRADVALASVDPRIHFALVCGAKSCPPIKTYQPAGIDEQLTAAAQAFFDGGACEVDAAKREISLSRIIKWYYSDFGGDDAAVLGWICSFLDEGPRREVGRLLDSGRFMIKYQHYSWESNGKD